MKFQQLPNSMYLDKETNQVLFPALLEPMLAKQKELKSMLENPTNETIKAFIDKGFEKLHAWGLQNKTNADLFQLLAHFVYTLYGKSEFYNAFSMMADDVRYQVYGRPSKKGNDEWNNGKDRFAPLFSKHRLLYSFIAISK